MTEIQIERIYKKAELLMRETLDPQHDFSHVLRVVKNALQIAELVDPKKEADKKILEIACLFHDITFIRHKPSLRTWLFEGRLAIRILRELEILDFLSQKDLLKIEIAIRHHGLSFPFRKLNRKKNIYCQILQDADTFDLFHEERIVNLKRLEKKTFFYKFISILHKPAAKFGKKKICYFLNFPHLAEKIDRIES
jgi:HD superfamily phosphodiesterase